MLIKDLKEILATKDENTDVEFIIVEKQTEYVVTLCVKECAKPMANFLKIFSGKL